MVGRRSYTAGVTAHSVFAERKAEEKPQTKWDQENERKAYLCLSCTEPDCKGTCARMRRYEFDELIPSIMADKIDELIEEVCGDEPNDDRLR